MRTEYSLVLSDQHWYLCVNKTANAIYKKRFNNNNDNKKGLSSKRSPPFCLKKGIKPVIALTRHNKKEKKEHIKSCSKTSHRVCKLCRLLATKKNGYTCSRNKAFQHPAFECTKLFELPVRKREKQKSIPGRMYWHSSSRRTCLVQKLPCTLPPLDLPLGQRPRTITSSKPAM